MPDQLWLHPSFGKRPIPYANIVSVRVEKTGRENFGGQNALIVERDKPVARNCVVWAYFTSSRRVAIRALVIDEFLDDVETFRDLLISCAAPARNEFHAGRSDTLD